MLALLKCKGRLEDQHIYLVFLTRLLLLYLIIMLMAILVWLWLIIVQLTYASQSIISFSIGMLKKLNLDDLKKKIHINCLIAHYDKHAAIWHGYWPMPVKIDLKHYNLLTLLYIYIEVLKCYHHLKLLPI